MKSVYTSKECTNGLFGSKMLSVKKGYNLKNRRLGSFRSSQERRAESVGSNSKPFPKCLKSRKMFGVRVDKVILSRENEAQFIVLCHQEYLNGQLLTTCFSRPTLSQIGDRLNALVGGNVKYGLPQLRTKWKNVKRAWKLLYGLRFKRRSGLGWDPEKETIVGTVEQLEVIYTEHRDNKSIIKCGPPHFNLCSEMFNKKVATGNHTRSSMQPSNESGAPEDEHLILLPQILKQLLHHNRSIILLLSSHHKTYPSRATMEGVSALQAQVTEMLCLSRLS